MKHTKQQALALMRKRQRTMAVAVYLIENAKGDNRKLGYDKMKELLKEPVPVRA
jgi:hypothetical protein